MLLDFDDCGWGWFLYDLGAALSFVEDSPRVPELVSAWVRGYRAEAPLSAAEVAELDTFVLLRRLLLVAWLGSHPDADLARTLGAAFTTAQLRARRELPDQARPVIVRRRRGVSARHAGRRTRRPSRRAG